MRRAISSLLAAVALTTSGQAGAVQSAADTAAAHNAAYDEAMARTFTTPVTVGEMLHCSAIWDRWAYVVESVADPAFEKGLREELSLRNAKSRQRHWERMARREMRGDDDDAYFESSRARGESEADETYARYVGGTERRNSTMIGWLASCR